MIGSSDNIIPYRRGKFGIWSSAFLLCACKRIITGREFGWDYRVCFSRGLSITTASARLKRSHQKYPAWLEAQPERSEVLQIQDVKENGESRTVFFAEWDGDNPPPTVQKYEAGAWEDRLVAAHEDIIADIRANKIARSSQEPAIKVVAYVLPWTPR